MLYGILLGIDVLVAIALIVMVLLHRGRGAEVGAVFSGGGASSVFGSGGAHSFLTRTVAILAAVFLINSLVLAYLANRDFSTRSVLDEAGIEFESGAGTTPTQVIGDDADMPPTEGADMNDMNGMDGMDDMDGASEAGGMGGMDGMDETGDMPDAGADGDTDTR